MTQLRFLYLHKKESNAIVTEEIRILASIEKLSECEPRGATYILISTSFIVFMALAIVHVNVVVRVSTGVCYEVLAPARRLSLIIFIYKGSFTGHSNLATVYNEVPDNARQYNQINCIRT